MGSTLCLAGKGYTADPDAIAGQASPVMHQAAGCNPPKPHHALAATTASVHDHLQASYKEWPISVRHPREGTAKQLSWTRAAQQLGRSSSPPQHSPPTACDPRKQHTMLSPPSSFSPLPHPLIMLPQSGTAQYVQHPQACSSVCGLFLLKMVYNTSIFAVQLCLPFACVCMSSGPCSDKHSNA